VAAERKWRAAESGVRSSVRLRVFMELVALRADAVVAPRPEGVRLVEREALEHRTEGL